MTFYRATLAYDGTAYYGFQRQREGMPSIQERVERAVATVTQQTVTITGAGRTDTGVHATGQVIAFEVEWGHDSDDLLRAVNAVLPEDIALLDLAALPQGTRFHPRFDAVSRVYTYTILQAPTRQPLMRQRAWRVHQPLDMRAMSIAGELLIGTHDFASFGKPPQGDITIRDVMISRWDNVEGLKEAPGAQVWMYTIEANAFLQHMVRRIVGALVDVGRGSRTVSEFEAMFRAARLMPNWTTAPPQGLVLTSVKYPDRPSTTLD